MESRNGSNAPVLEHKVATETDSVKGHKASHAGTGNPSVTAPSLVETCFNYLNSKVPCRVMFYNHGDWHDFPDSVVKILIDGFKKEKSSIRFSIGNEPLLLDFLSMVVINLRTKKQRSVAWVDEKEKCFFPTLFEHDADASNEWDFENLGSRFVQIGVRTVDVPPAEVIKHVVGESSVMSPRRPLTAADALRFKLETLPRGTMCFLSVQKQFLLGMGPFARPGDILYIHRYDPKDRSGQKRKETFETLIKLTQEERGNANVQFAWFGAKKADIAGVLVQGFGKPTEGILGTGLYLTPAGRSFASVNHCDVDEHGMQYIILCRVILGNMEQVRAGTKQYYPSSGDYDSGVDNLSNPKCYVVWPTHTNTYVNPEYLVSFKLAPNVQEYLSGLMDIRYHLATTPDLSTLHPDSVNPPPIPWVPFTGLLQAIQPQVSPLAMELLLHHYQELKNRAIDRDELIKKIRIIVGDQLLSSVLTRFKREPILFHGGPPVKRVKQEEPSTSQVDMNGNNAMNAPNESHTWPSRWPNGTM